MIRRYVFGLAAATLVAAPAAHAQDFPGIQTPSHNIFCMAMPITDEQPQPVLRCDILNMTGSPPPPDTSCQEDYGDAFSITATGRAERICHGDTVANPSVPVLGYGHTWNVMGFACASATSGLTCQNGAGHGFTLSREAQRLF